MIDQLRRLHPYTFARALPIGMVAGALIGIPSDLIDTPLFGRSVASRPIDYVILVITAALIGLIFAIRAEPLTVDEASSTEDPMPIWGGFVSFLAVGCPACNQVVAALVGTSGALSWWAPIQPLVGVAAIALLVLALRRRLSTYDAAACRLPTTL
jgi:hypothetical protein